MLCPVFSCTSSESDSCRILEDRGGFFEEGFVGVRALSVLGIWD